MNKYKTRIFAALIVTSVIITSCGFLTVKNKTTASLPELQQATKGTEYINGSFIGYSDASDHGYSMAIVTVENDKIVNVVLKEFTELSVEKDFSTYEYKPSVTAHRELPQRFIAAGDTQVEGISGATASSARYRQAVERALARARKQKPAGTYFDGTFQGRSRADNHGYGIALVKIQNDRITGVEIKEVDEKGELKDFSTYPYEPSRRAFKEIPGQFVKKNSPDIDNFTGATHSTEKYREAVANALAKAKKIMEMPDLIDGTYTAVSDADSQGYAEATLTVENGLVADVKLKEYDGLCKEKDFSSYKYEPAVNANRELPWAFIAAQTSRVDAVTGATRSSTCYSQAVERALAKASWYKGQQKYLNGIFQAKSTTDEHGYCIAIVTLRDDRIQSVVLKDIDDKGQLKDFENYPYEPSKKAHEELPAKFVEANSYEVDMVSGATHSSEKYMEAVKKALESATLNFDVRDSKLE
ncbi:MAG TPA: FMN-binding protein [Thermoanaerobacterales bacterium]|nr:FMN-binding protein [Thermoanaerobacterales bacterium]